MADRISIRDLAKIAGVSRTTVSLALRDSQEISPAVRERIKALARKHDYRSHPAVNFLMQQVRSGRRVHDEEVIAFVTTGDEPIERSPLHMEIEAAARDEAYKMGYRIENFWAGYMACNAGKLARILYNRGIRGVLWGPMPYPHPPIIFPWEKFIPISCTPSTEVPNLPVVSIHHPKGMALILETLEQRGAERIGVVVHQLDDLRHDHGWMSGVDLYRHRGGKKHVIPRVFTTSPPFPRLDSWIKKNRLNALVLTQNMFEDTEYLDGKIARASLDVPKHDRGRIGGLYQDKTKIGRHAVRFLSLRLANNNFGLPEYSYSVVIQASFIDGDSLSLLKKA